MSVVFSTPPDRAVIGSDGWLAFGNDLEITAAPALDPIEPGLFARLTYHDALIFAAMQGGRLLTMQEHDIVWRDGFRLRPVIMRPGAYMASIEYAREHDAKVCAQLDTWDGCKPLANAGKQWVGGAAKGRALNYGWWDSKAPNGRMWQTLGTRHDDRHTDYSQLTLIVRPRQRL